MACSSAAVMEIDMLWDLRLGLESCICQKFHVKGGLGLFSSFMLTTVYGWRPSLERAWSWRDERPYELANQLHGSNDSSNHRPNRRNWTSFLRVSSCSPYR